MVRAGLCKSGSISRYKKTSGLVFLESLQRGFRQARLLGRCTTTSQAYENPPAIQLTLIGCALVPRDLIWMVVGNNEGWLLTFNGKASLHFLFGVDFLRCEE